MERSGSEKFVEACYLAARYALFPEMESWWHSALSLGSLMALALELPSPRAGRPRLSVWQTARSQSALVAGIRDELMRPAKASRVERLGQESS